MKTESKIKIINAWLCQIEEKSITPIFCDFIVDKGVIKNVNQKSFDNFVNKTYKEKPDEYNVGGRVITAPLVNFHDHIYSRLAKGLPTLGPQDNFHNVLKNLWWKLDKALDEEMIRASAEMAVMESIRNGVTYIFDHHASPLAVKNSLTTISSVLMENNLRGMMCYEISDRDGEDVTRNAFDETMNFISNHRNENIGAFVGLHASFTLKDETLRRVTQIVNSYNMGIHIHLCEDGIDREISLKEYKASPIQRLKANHLLNKKSILSHGIHLTKEDYPAIAREGCAIAYNPDSNLNNSVGLPDFSAVPTSIPILTGTDGMHADIAKSMKQLYLLSRHQKNSFNDAFGWFIKIYFDQLKFVKLYFPDFTKLQQNDRADFIVWDYIPPTPIDNSNFWGHYIYGILERPVISVAQGGKFLMRNFEIQTANESEIMKNIFKHGKRLHQKFQSMIEE